MPKGRTSEPESTTVILERSDRNHAVMESDLVIPASEPESPAVIQK
jgi:hypothetical protein